MLFGSTYTVRSKIICVLDDYNREKTQVMFKVFPENIQKFIDTLNCVLKDTGHIAQFKFRMYSVMAIVESSIMWGLLQYTESGARINFDHPVKYGLIFLQDHPS